MSCNYADSLSHYENKGKLGLPEKFDADETVKNKVQLLCQWLKESKHTVVHTGAGISTSAGIPDFRGPNGVWTLEQQKKKPSVNISWDDAKPTFTHMALLALQKAGHISYIITQNVDGLHLRSGIPRKNIAELHGNLYVDKCNTCQRQFVRHKAAETVAQKSRGVSCPGRRSVKQRRCRGKLHDTILDWEDSLPEFDLELSHMNSCIADLSLCLGTTLQIVPSGNLPLLTKRRGGKLVICNLQPTKQDKQANLLIHTYVDDIFKMVLKTLEVDVIDYDPSNDPVLISRNKLSDLRYDFSNSVQLPDKFIPIEWTVPEKWVKNKDLLEQVKNRKVIKRKSVVETEIVSKKYKNASDTIKDVQKQDDFKCVKDVKDIDKYDVIKEEILSEDNKPIKSDIHTEEFSVKKIDNVIIKDGDSLN